MNVEDLLKKEDLPFIVKGSDYLIRCLNPEHPDRHPSMRIDKITGIFNCFSCNFKGNIFTFFGEKVNFLQMRRELLKKKIREKSVEGVALSMPSMAVAYQGDWRNISPETYRKFEAFEESSAEFIGRIVFPIRDLSGKIVAFNARHTTGGTPKYIFSPRGCKLPLFPVVTPVNGAVILVEGIFDMLNLYDKGISNSMCCFGVGNVNEEKLTTLKIRGVDSIDIFFDGDEAGQKGVEKLKLLCEKVELQYRNIYIKDTDPGQLTQSQVDKLKEKLC